ncbi:MAG: ATP-binding protein [Candidatus Hydrogenedentes bacterium]|nr:ATP-binding protein [Candidatus Hydrogenedentota bacterium]
MPKTPWTPWHEVVALREDVKTGDLALNSFAADLYEVKLGRARPVYQDPREFFALTYPTRNLRELVKDVIYRLAGKNEKAVRQLELTYGGGKTHTLITLYHLVTDPERLPNDLSSVQEFRSHLDGLTPPKTRVVVLSFDKLDIEKGMEIADPAGKLRWLKEPWSVLAWQIAGADGLKLLHGEGKDKERESAPAEPLLQTLLSKPQEDGLSTLVLLDEVLMYARDKINRNKAYEGYLESFFQALTQAATKVKHCAVVASLLATDPRKMDTSGQRIVSNLSDLFRREQEESVQPVEKQDVAEVLRRRFFTPESIQQAGAFKSHVLAALKGVYDLDDQTKREGNIAEERFEKSYPFHPDLTEVLYTKWTSMPRFQRTRGVLRTFALGLRDAVSWDQCPLVGINVFLAPPAQTDLAESLRELTAVASAENNDGQREEWDKIIQGELDKAKSLERETTALHHRELEQAVISTFLHSQPKGKQALTRDLMILLGPTRPDKIEMEKALRRWTEVSWFLDEARIEDAELGPTGQKLLPKAWRLGSEPNLKQMHSEAFNSRVSDATVEEVLIKNIGETKSLTQGASAAGARVHTLPTKPSDIEDDGEFHFTILGPRSVSTSGNPSAEAQRFINETTAANRPRVNRNAVVLVAPERNALDAARNAVRDYLAWDEVRLMLAGKDLDVGRQARLANSISDAKNKIPEAIKQAYCVVITVNDKGDIQAFKITVESDPLFTTVKNDKRSRIQENPIEADALLPDGPFDLWRGGETERRVKDLAGAFAQFPHLPKMLRHQEILGTLARGAEQGSFVLRARRPDGSLRTFWMQRPNDADMKDPSLELVLPENAELSSLAGELLVPNVLPQLWPKDREISVKSVKDYFAGGKVVQVSKGGFDEPLTIPKAPEESVLEAVRHAVLSGAVWLVAGQASIWKESIPAGVLNDAAELLPPPSAIPVTHILKESLPDAWEHDATTAIALLNAWSAKAGCPQPWPLVKEAIDSALRGHYLERTEDSGPWPCDIAAASSVRLRGVTHTVPTGGQQPPTVSIKPGVRRASAVLTTDQLQDLADQIGEIKKAAAGAGLEIYVTIEVGNDTLPSEGTMSIVGSILRGISDRLELK